MSKLTPFTPVGGMVIFSGHTITRRKLKIYGLMSCRVKKETKNFQVEITGRLTGRSGATKLDKPVRPLILHKPSALRRNASSSGFLHIVALESSAVDNP
jgi:hypothetical protein